MEGCCSLSSYCCSQRRLLFRRRPWLHGELLLSIIIVVAVVVNAIVALRVVNVVCVVWLDASYEQLLADTSAVGTVDVPALSTDT